MWDIVFGGNKVTYRCHGSSGWSELSALEGHGVTREALGEWSELVGEMAMEI